MVKQVMKCYYAHKSNVEELVSCEDNHFWNLSLRNAIKNCPYAYDVIKYDKANRNVSFISSLNWDSANEPIVGDSNIYYIPTGEWKFKPGRKKNFQIYHNKWQFVSENYTGFDIEEAKQRTETWNAIPNINEHKSRIGNQDYWFQLLDENGIER